MAMRNSNGPLGRAMTLAAVSGLRMALGPALLAAARNDPNRKMLTLAALGEMAFDKLPFVPSRSSLPLLLPRALVGAWVAREVMREEGEEGPWAPIMGAVVAAGVATLAPTFRNTLERVLGFPNFALGLAEDYLALRLGGEATGLSMDDLKQIGGQAVDEIKQSIAPVVQSVGAGSI